MRHYLLVALLFSLTLRAADPECPPPLSKDDARRILVAMTYGEISVVAVIQGINAKKVAAPTLALVLALAKRDGVFQNVQLDLYYDRDIGWFGYESTPKSFRVWTRDGYRELNSLNTW
jgi:hypothetical protein